MLFAFCWHLSLDLLKSELYKDYFKSVKDCLFGMTIDGIYEMLKRSSFCLTFTYLVPSSFDILGVAFIHGPGFVCFHATMFYYFSPVPSATRSEVQQIVVLQVFPDTFRSFRSFLICFQRQ